MKPLKDERKNTAPPGRFAKHSIFSIFSFSILKKIFWICFGNFKLTNSTNLLWSQHFRPCSWAWSRLCLFSLVLSKSWFLRWFSTILSNLDSSRWRSCEFRVLRLELRKDRFRNINRRKLTFRRLVPTLSDKNYQ